MARIKFTWLPAYAIAAFPTPRWEGHWLTFVKVDHDGYLYAIENRAEHNKLLYAGFKKIVSILLGTFVFCCAAKFSYWLILLMPISYLMFHETDKEMRRIEDRVLMGWQ